MLNAIHKARLLFMGTCLLSPLLAVGQGALPAEDAQGPATEPLIFKHAANQPSPTGQELADIIARLRKELHEITAADIPEREKQQRLDQMMRDHPYIFDSSNVDVENEQAVDAAVLHLETLFFEVAAQDALTPASKLEVLDAAPATQVLEQEKPALIAPLENSNDMVFEQRVVEPQAQAQPQVQAPAQAKTTPAATAPVPKKTAATQSKSGVSLTAQASDPTSPLVQAQITYLYSDVVHDSSDNARQLLIEPVIPIPPNKLISMAQIVRPTIPFLDAPDGKSGLGDIDIEHVFIPEGHSWGALGFGYSATLPTADHKDLGADKYQLGPASTIIYYGIDNWQMGGTATQVWSIAGKKNADDVSEFTFQPILNYIVGPWYVGIGDFTWSYNWKGDEGWTIPLGFQVGRITQIGKYKYNLSAELLWTAQHDGGGPYPERGVKFGFVLLLPE